jgi:hypothetical protein
MTNIFANPPQHVKVDISVRFSSRGLILFVRDYNNEVGNF